MAWMVSASHSRCWAMAMITLLFHLGMSDYLGGVSQAGHWFAPSVSGEMLGEMAHVLFVCLHNAGRSQMSRALFEQAAQGRHTAASAGTEPAEQVHPEVLVAMKELGLDLSDQKPKLLTTELAQEADVVVTMGCGDACPYIPGKKYVDWDLTDPKGLPVEQVRGIRDDISKRVQELVHQLDS
jgi:arsenate reductase (thioredoxin)